MTEDIRIQEIDLTNIDEFWDLHWKYLNDDIFNDTDSKEDRDYFRDKQYRAVLLEHMLREKDKHHMLYFYEGDQRIGACQYTTYQSEDGKCIILDYWIFPEFRNKGRGSRCFDTLLDFTKADGAIYYVINITSESGRRFWLRQGFRDDGLDEWAMPLMRRD